jgi:hypothetical protein
MKEIYHLDKLQIYLMLILLNIAKLNVAKDISTLII